MDANQLEVPVMVRQIDGDGTYHSLMAECLTLCELDPEPGTKEATRLMALAIALEIYERSRWPCEWSS